jgi:hypothetical protein
VRKGFASPRACALTNPLRSAGRLSLPAERRVKGGGLRRKARGFPHSRRQSRFFPDFDATLERKVWRLIQTPVCGKKEVMSKSAKAFDYAITLRFADGRSS